MSDQDVAAVPAGPRTLVSLRDRFPKFQQVLDALHAELDQIETQQVADLERQAAAVRSRVEGLHARLDNLTI